MNDSGSEKFWNSPNAKGYPNILRLGDQEYQEPGEGQRALIGEQMKKMGWITDGEKLDLGAGPSTGWIYGSEETANNVWAVDFSPKLLSRSGVPEERRIVADLRNMKFSDKWRAKFVLATAVLLFRYLTSQERRALMRQVKNSLSPNGRLVIIDIDDMRPEKLSRELGEVEVFDRKATEVVFSELGFTGIESGIWDLELMQGGDYAPFSVDWATGVKP